MVGVHGGLNANHTEVVFPKHAQPVADGEKQFLDQLRIVLQPLVLFIRDKEQQLLRLIALLIKQRVREQQNRRFAKQQQGGAGLQLRQGQGG